MTAHPMDKHGVVIRDATRSDVESLSTIIPRSFAPDAFLNRIFPPRSEAIRQWWVNIYNAAVDFPNCRILVATKGKQAIGVFTLHLWCMEYSQLAGPGILSLIPSTEDHDDRFADILISQAELRRKIMGQEPNYLVDLMAVDREYQGTGVGKSLLCRACKIADERQVAMFLQTTKARTYYLKQGLGFESEDTGDEPSGWVKRPDIRRQSCLRMQTRPRELVDCGDH